MKKNTSAINEIWTKFLLPFLICFAFYIQVYGEITPGGGFQAGSLFASCLITYDLSISRKSNVITSQNLLRAGSIGMLIYLGVGSFSFLNNNNFLDYEIFGYNHGDQIGITIVEIGIGVTVGSILLLIYQEIKNAN